MKKRLGLIITLAVLGGVILTLLIIGLTLGGSAVLNIFNFILNQIIGLEWFNSFIGFLLSAIFGTAFSSGNIGSAIQFFLYDVVRNIFILCLLMFVISYALSFFPTGQTNKILGKFHGIGASIVGALVGTVTPSCSCSSIPIFIGFTRAGIASGVSFSFLLSCPLIDLASFILLTGIFGWKIALAYVIIGLIFAVIGGVVLEKSGADKELRNIVKNENTELNNNEVIIKNRFAYSVGEVTDTLKKVWLYIIIGVAIGAVIHNFIPQNIIENLLGSDKWYSVIIATIIGAPIYSEIFGAVPIADVLFAKGAGVGTIISFIMAVTVISLPSIIMLARVVKTKLLVRFIMVTIIGIIIIGYLFNIFGYFLL